VEFYRRIPHTVVASVKLRKPIGVIGSSVLGVVDEDGMVFGEVKDSTLPKLLYDQPLQTGDRLPDDYVISLGILSRIAVVTGQKTEGKLAGKILTVTLASDTEIIIDITKPQENWAASLQAIFTRSKIDGKSIRKLDLRYLDPVVID